MVAPRRSFVLALLIATLAVVVGCTSGSSPSGSSGGGSTDDAAGTPDTVAADTGNTGTYEPASVEIGGACTAGEACKSDICYRGTCVATCASPADCDAGQDCSSDDGARKICVTPKYPSAIGKPCAVEDSCDPEGLKCLGGIAVAGAYCTQTCSDDTDCPARYRCSSLGDAGNYCVERTFCAPCVHDGNCAAGAACLNQGAKSYCARPCNQGSTECPGYAYCGDVGNDNWQCVHKAGACVGDGSQCSACNEDTDCVSGGRCLTYTMSHESFCAESCSGGCPSGTSCYDQIGQCVQSGGSADALPTCVNKLSLHMEKGDIMNDFAMVGRKDSNGNGNLSDDPLTLVRMSDFSDRKLIVMNISAVWCSVCRYETTLMKNAMAKYGSKGLTFFQVLYEGPTQGSNVALGHLDSWIKQFNPQGASGVDPTKLTSPINSKPGSTPLNLLIDAKTRKVLFKTNGLPQDGIESLIEYGFALLP
mgnify:CR=1 FL=1